MKLKLLLALTALSVLVVGGVVWAGTGNILPSVAVIASAPGFWQKTINLLLLIFLFLPE